MVNVIVLGEEEEDLKINQRRILILIYHLNLAFAALVIQLDIPVTNLR